MNIKFDSKQIIEDLKRQEISIYFASPNNIDIILNNKNFNEFNELINDLNVKVIFVEITKLEVEEIEENIITDFDVPGTYKRDILKEEVDGHNKKLEEMRQFVGQEQDMRLFFSHQGTIYSWMLFNDDLFVMDKVVLLNEWFEDYEEEINESKEKARTEREEQLYKYYEKLRGFLFNSEAFKKCKNKYLRRAFIFNALREEEELKKLEPPYTTAASVMDVVEDVWRTMKLKENSII
ncbi:hypothetical protein MNQ98_10730 [Paenibacillus sp. N3/727]|uniref:hypothetical protein n=1 Tax=Paenibacillus sp. N3/727 TaxID=2925845 RepID=UPI001F536407|nr:hypothetical protein [Paenibacillus sp. N3/727]UNK20449.1 hypothetical protein MNQ98_10730 [Paenibacillus sp. N3/727]